MKIYDNWCRPDEGKQFILTQKGKDECVSLRHYEVGKTIPDWEHIPAWAWNSEYFIEVDIPGFVFGLKGYKVGYYHPNGTFLHCGNPQTFPTREAAEKYAKHYAAHPWCHENIIIEEAEYNGIPLNEPKMYNGKPVVDQEHYFGLDAHEVGEYFDDNMVDDFMNMLPPACYRSDCSQIGEPSSHKLDEETGKARATYATFKRIAEDVWEYCGDCFRGENVMRGKELQYV